MARRNIGFAGMVLAALALSVWGTGCGGGSKPATAKSTLAGALSTTASGTSTPTSTTSTNATANKNKHASEKKPAPKQHGSGGSSSGTTTNRGSGSSSTTTSTTTHRSSTKTGSGASKPSATSSTHRNPPAPTVAPLPGPTVSGSSGGLHVSLHADNHAPKAGKPWHYSVRAVDGSGHALSGTADTEFVVFGGQVVGRETPPTQPLRSGRVNDSVTYPARSIGIPLSFRVVIHTHLRSVTLNWPVTVKR